MLNRIGKKYLKILTDNESYEKCLTDELIWIISAFLI